MRLVFFRARSTQISTLAKAAALLAAIASAPYSAESKTITQIIDSSGDGAGMALELPFGIAVGAAGDVYITGSLSDNVFHIDPNGTITQIIDLTGDGSGNNLAFPFGIAVGSSGSVYVTGQSSNNVFRIDSNGVITEIIDSTGDGCWEPTLACHRHSR